MFSLDDTIAAISTPLGEGGIGIVRLSGPDARTILSRLFRPGLQSPTSNLHPRRLTYGQIVDPADGSVVDEVLAVYMPAPRTYTREDVVEIQAHGGPVPLRRILELVLRQGARLAEPGEFTVRAFLHGRLDLAQAEAVLDIVRARTEAGLRAAVGQLEGRLSGEVRRVRQALLDVLAYLEASIDFTEDEIPPQDLTPVLRETAAQLEALLARADEGIILRQGVRTAIVGRPNVGKSSLLNALLRSERAIVTPIPGTTRDTVEESVNLGGVAFVLVDTAGIAETQDVVERLGVERSRQTLAHADLALLVVDGSQPLTDVDREIAALIGDRPAILVVNKCDLPPVQMGDALLPHAPRVEVSALTGQGLAELEAKMTESVLAGRVVSSDAPLVTNPRHKAALARALEAVRAAGQAHAEGLPADLVSVHVTTAVHALGEITGETISEELLETIFANFCVGK
jgi:tRNA modification GTPase